MKSVFQILPTLSQRTRLCYCLRSCCYMLVVFLNYKDALLVHTDQTAESKTIPNKSKIAYDPSRPPLLLITYQLIVSQSLTSVVAFPSYIYIFLPSSFYIFLSSSHKISTSSTHLLYSSHNDINHHPGQTRHRHAPQSRADHQSHQYPWNSSRRYMGLYA